MKAYHITSCTLHSLLLKPGCYRGAGPLPRTLYFEGAAAGALDALLPAPPRPPLGPLRWLAGKSVLYFAKTSRLRSSSRSRSFFSCSRRSFSFRFASSSLFFSMTRNSVMDSPFKLENRGSLSTRKFDVEVRHTTTSNFRVSVVLRHTHEALE